MAHLNPYLHFDGNCKEAMTFYHDCLGGKLNIQTVGDSPMAASSPPESHNHVIHSTLESDGFLLMASDGMGGEAQTPGNTITRCLVCQSKEEIEAAYAKLSAGGTIGHPLKEEFFGTFGDCVDKYGMSWMFQYSANPMM